MSFNAYHKFDNEFVKYLETRFFLWKKELSGPNDVSWVIYDGAAGRQLKYLPVIFRYRHIHEKALTVPSILAKNNELTTPFLLVTPLDIIDVHDTMPYVEPVTILDPDDPDNTLTYRDHRRVQFQYQIEGLSSDWIDHQMLNDLIFHKIVTKKYDQAYISLFNRTYTCYLEMPQVSHEEDSNFMRAVCILKIEASIFTVSPESAPTVIEKIVNISDIGDDQLYDSLIEPI
jgi:hypothetical protein